MNKTKAILIAILLILVPLSLTACFKTNKKPIASFTASANSGYPPLEISFKATDSYDPDGTILTYQWDFRDGTTGSGETILHTFKTEGSYNVKLTITDDEGAKDSKTRLIEILQTPSWVDNVIRAWVVAHPHNWDADAENDGLRVWAEIQNEDEEMIKYENVEMPTKIDIYSTESKTYPLEPARLIYSDSSVMKKWYEDAFVSGATGIEDIPWGEMSTSPTEQSYGIIYITVTLPNGKDYSARYDPVTITP